MSDKKISELTELTAVDHADDVFAIVDDSASETKKIKISTVSDWFRTSTASDTNSANEVIIGVTDTSSPRTVTLLTANLRNGKIFIVKDESGNAGTNNITVATQASETIDGAATATISTNYGVVRIYSDGTNYFTF